MGLRGPTAKESQNLPKFELGVPPKPNNLSEVASKHWDEVTPKLDRAGLLTEADGHSLEIMCEAYADYVRYRELMKAGALVKGAKGTIIANPAHRLMRETLKLYNECSSMFGMNPKARMRVAAYEKPLGVKESKGIIEQAHKGTDVIETIVDGNDISALLSKAAREEIKNEYHSP